MVGVILIFSMCVCGMCLRLCSHLDDERRSRTWRSRRSGAPAGAVEEVPSRPESPLPAYEQMPPPSISSSVDVIAVHPPPSSTHRHVIYPWAPTPGTRPAGGGRGQGGTPSPPPTPPPPSYDSLFPDRATANNNNQPQSTPAQLDPNKY